MLGIFLYCVGVMYTPGPVNILSLNRGAQGRLRTQIAFCLGVGTALFFWFLLVGYTGSAIISQDVLPFISALGSGFILYLAYKVISSEVEITHDRGMTEALTFRDGFLLQLLNPKSFLVVLPVATVQFPSAGINGSEITLWSFGLGVLGFGAPFAYAAVGSSIFRYVSHPHWLKRFNVFMGIMLIAVAIDIAYNHIYLILWP